MILALLTAVALNGAPPAAPDLVMRISLFGVILPESKAVADVRIANRGATAADFAVRIVFPQGTKILEIGDTGDLACDVFLQRVVICTARTFGRPTQFPIRFQVPPLYDGGVLTVRGVLMSAQRDLVPDDNIETASVDVERFFTVNTTADDGAGSLRQAILDANATCATQRCTIGFRIPGPLPHNGFFTIQPKTPMPPIEFRGTVQGAAQIDFLDLEGTAPRVMLDGSLLRHGDGLLMRTSTDVRSVAVGNFPGAGIRYEPVPGSTPPDELTVLWFNYLGLDPTGRVAAPNDHGLVDNAEQNRFAMSGCVLSGNRRSGLVAANRSFFIYNSRIGIAAESDAPIPNGASGIYLTGEDDGTSFIEKSVIANHPHFGIALQPEGARSVRISDNSIYGNRGLAIDYGLDGLTPNGNDAERFPNHPTIVEVGYRPDWKLTEFEVRLDNVRGRPSFFPGQPLEVLESTVDVEVYASRTPGQTERLLQRIELGDVFADRPRSFVRGDSAFTDDLRGWWITAIAIRQHIECTAANECRFLIETSEVGPGMQVR